MAFIVDRDVEITKFTQGRRIRHMFFCFFLRQLADEFVLPIIAVSGTHQLQSVQTLNILCR